jgi:hypothetical protein
MFKHVYTNNCDRPVTDKTTNTAEPARPVSSAEVGVIEAIPRVSGRKSEELSYTYMKLNVRFAPTGTAKSCCVDTGCTRPVVGQDWIDGHEDVTYDHSQSTSFEGITNEVTLHKRAIFLIYVHGKVDGKERLGRITVTAWVMDRLKPGLLLGNEFLYQTSFIVSFQTSTLTIGACGSLIADVTVLHQTPRVIRKIVAARKVVIPPRSRAIVPVQCTPVPNDGIYFFQSCLDGAEDAVLDHANFVSVVNDTDTARTILARTKLGRLSNVENQAFLAGEGDGDEEETVTQLPLEDDEEPSEPWHERQYKFGIDKPQNVPEVVHENGVHIFNGDEAVA